VKANFLPKALTGKVRSWLISLLEGSITSWDQLCAMFIRNFQGIYERPYTAESLKTIRQKHDESLQDYVKHFCNARNVIPYIEIINAFRDGVSDIRTVEEIAMRKPKMVAELLAVADVCIEAFEARARLLESRGKGPSRKKDDWEVNTTDRGDRKDRGDHKYRGKQSSEQKENRPFQCLDDAKKWCEIHRTAGHDLKECKTFLDHKKMLPPAAPAPQDPHRGKHHREDPNDDEHMVEINMIFRGSMSNTSKMHGKELQCGISLAQ
jgi:hypothetical protein